MTETVTNRGKTRILAGDTSLDTSDLRILAFTGTAVGTDNPDLNTVADLDAVAGVSIHTERLALVNKTVTQDDVNNRANADCDNVVFAAAAGVTAAGVAIYDEGGGTDATRHLIAIYSTGFPKPMDGGLTISVGDWLRGT